MVEPALDFRERRQLGFVTLNSSLAVSGWWILLMTVDSVMKSHVKISSHKFPET